MRKLLLGLALGLGVCVASPAHAQKDAPAKKTVSDVIKLPTPAEIKEMQVQEPEERHLVASAVNGLKPERVSIVDEAGRLLADGARTEQALGLSADERQVAFERRLREQVETIVTSVVGPGRARVQLTADFDFNRVTQTSEKFDPDTLAAADAVALAEAVALAQADVEIETGPTRRSQHQRKSSTRP